MKARLLAFVFVALLSASGQKLDKLPPEALQAINPTELRKHLEFLAAPEFGGRYTLSPQFQVAAKYLATRLESYGYKGAAKDGSFFQKFDVVTSKADREHSSLSLTVKGDKSEHKYGEFYNAGYVGGDVEAPIVFVGNGISSSAVKHDDYAGLDVKGKIVLIAGGTPAGIDADRVGEKHQGAAAAAAHGAAAALLLPLKYQIALMKSGVMQKFSKEQVRLAVDKEDKIPAVRLGVEASERLLSLMGMSLNEVLEAKMKRRPLKPQTLDASAELHLKLDQDTQTTQNVVAVLQGTDPKLKDEYVTFSAHYDHLKTSEDGKVYPGADDDGSGTVSVLAIAKAISIHKPKRSTLIIFHAGEELGLLGSEYNADYAPVVPLSQMVTDLNIDMTGRNRDSNPGNAEIVEKNSIYPIGADKISKQLNDIHEQTNKDYEKLVFDYRLNDPNDPQRFYFRSDHWNYAKHGVPIIFWFDGTGVDYHQPTDTVDKIDFEKIARVARLAYGTGYRVSNLDQKLKRDHVYVVAD